MSKTIFDDLKDPNFNFFKQDPTKKVEKDPNDVIKGDTAFENGLRMLIGTEFGGQASGFEVRWEARNFRPSQFGDKFLKNINAQYRGRQPKIAEIYLLGRYLCDVSESMKPTEVIDVIQAAIARQVLKTG